MLGNWLTRLVINVSVANLAGATGWKPILLWSLDILRIQCDDALGRKVA
jgi:hypothetical protein